MSKLAAFGGGGVSQLVAGTGVTLSPSGGTGAVTVSTSSGGLAKYAVDIGDGSTLTYTVTHSLNTEDIAVTVYATGTPYDVVYPTVDITTVNALTVTFSSAPALNAFRVVVIG